MILKIFQILMLRRSSFMSHMLHVNIWNVCILFWWRCLWLLCLKLLFLCNLEITRSHYIPNHLPDDPTLLLIPFLRTLSIITAGITSSAVCFLWYQVFVNQADVLRVLLLLLLGIKEEAFLGFITVMVATKLTLEMELGRFVKDWVRVGGLLLLFLLLLETVWVGLLLEIVLKFILLMEQLLGMFELSSCIWGSFTRGFDNFITRSSISSGVNLRVEN
jgi:hypothetical protein